MGFRLVITGCVQGVGFRPFVYHLAQTMGLVGNVKNTTNGVEITLYTDSQTIKHFCYRLQTERPTAATIDNIQQDKLSDDVVPCHFEILNDNQQKQSNEACAVIAPSPDILICQACLMELTDTHNRRFAYPFINCTQCGPRFSIISGMPYDRINTAMMPFSLCFHCTQEYQNPNNRRFHAEPIACQHCGPNIWLKDNNGTVIDGQTDTLLAQSCRWLLEGKVLALKGISGFQLACDATQPSVIARLRQRKYRPAKPLAMMMKDLNQASQFFYLSENESLLLASCQSPIVLLAKSNLKQRLPDQAKHTWG